MHVETILAPISRARPAGCDAAGREARVGGGDPPLIPTGHYPAGRLRYQYRWLIPVVCDAPAPRKKDGRPWQLIA